MFVARWASSYEALLQFLNFELVELAAYSGRCVFLDVDVRILSIEQKINGGGTMKLLAGAHSCAQGIYIDRHSRGIFSARTCTAGRQPGCRQAQGDF